MRGRIRNGRALTFGSAGFSPLLWSLGVSGVIFGVLLLSSIARGAGPTTYVFSDVRHVVDVDDYVGTEIVVRVDPRSKRVTGQWDLYQGYDPLTMQLEGTLVGSRLELKGMDSDGRPELTAVFSEKMISGTLGTSVRISKPRRYVCVAFTAGCRICARVQRNKNREEAGNKDVLRTFPVHRASSTRSPIRVAEFGRQHADGAAGADGLRDKARGHLGGADEELSCHVRKLRTSAASSICL
jgi:hypothetical protein